MPDEFGPNLVVIGKLEKNDYTSAIIFKRLRKEELHACIFGFVHA